MRAVAKAEEQTVVVLVNVLARAGVDPFELGEIGGSVKAILDLAKDELKYHSFNTNFAQVCKTSLPTAAPTTPNYHIYNTYGHPATTLYFSWKLYLRFIL